MDAVVALHPDDAFEAHLAVRVVSTGAHAGDALCEASLATDPETERQCRAQAASMTRAFDSALRALLRIQAKREKQDAEMHPAAMGRAGYWFKEVSVPAPEHDPGPPPPPAAAEAEPARDIEAEADMYAIMYPDRAARILAAGGLPAKLDFGPPDPELVEALVHASSPRLRGLAVPKAGTRSLATTL